ncbi:MAG TPA: D-aminoacylase [Candidatus Saccharimonadales bacterium]|nr:D-aminoacylase [Candidatus Saccharimonadales bacterium]
MVQGVLIHGATVVDGTGAPGRRADVLVRGGRIAAVGRRAGTEPGDRVVDGDGLALAPGFIDLHSHADFTLPAFPAAINSLSQGVTSEVVGNCGYSPAPLAGDPGRAEEFRAYARGIGPDLDWSWRSFGEYLARLAAARPAVNCMPLAGHGALRVAAMGMADREATLGEIATMRRDLRDALAAGAWGMSTGLVYPPGVYAPTAEIVEVGRELTHAGALYASHIRNEADGLLGAVDEALAIGLALGVRVEISHLKAAGRRNHGHVPHATAAIAEARARGLDVHCDAYPYDAGSTFLSQLMPPWVHDGGVDGIVERLGSAEVRARIRADIEHGLPGWPNLLEAAGSWDRILIASVGSPARAFAEGSTVARLAADAGVDPLEWTFDLLVEDRAAPVMIITMMDEEDVDAALRFEATGIGSDQLGVTSDSARVHPRCYGAFARVLGRYVRERGVLQLETAIHRMTGLPAAVLGLRERGRIATGAIADLVLFDPATVADQATYRAPTRRALGIEAVLLGGRFAVDGGQIVARDLGQVLRRGES